jgi:hypothetical protein
MANHAAAGLVNAVLKMLDREQVFAFLGKQRSRALVRQILRTADSYDAPSGEILWGVEEPLHLCRWCFQDAEDLEKGLCSACRQKA